jgi:hypothetical protein
VERNVVIGLQPVGLVKLDKVANRRCRPSFHLELRAAGDAVNNWLAEHDAPNHLLK